MVPKVQPGKTDEQPQRDRILVSVLFLVAPVDVACKKNLGVLLTNSREFEKHTKENKESLAH